jgi:hypothetical protein
MEEKIWHGLDPMGRNCKGRIVGEVYDGWVHLLVREQDPVGRLRGFLFVSLSLSLSRRGSGGGVGGFLSRGGGGGGVGVG